MKYKILYIEDNPDNSMLVKRAVKHAATNICGHRMGYRVLKWPNSTHLT